MAHGRANVVFVVLGMAVYTAAVRRRRKAAVAVLVVVELALGAAMLTAAAGARSQQDMVRGLLVAAALWFVGDSVRERRRYLAGLAEQAAQQQRAEAERSRQAVREERVRIARELHDVVAHSLSVVTVQAGVGRRIEAAVPGEALRALRAVEVTGRAHSRNCAASSACCATTSSHGPAWLPRRASRTSMNWPRWCARPGYRSAWP